MKSPFVPLPALTLTLLMVVVGEVKSNPFVGSVTTLKLGIVAALPAISWMLRPSATLSAISSMVIAPLSTAATV